MEMVEMERAARDERRGHPGAGAGMGVTGLWDLLAPCTRRVSTESLARKRIAVDVSIWLIQFIKAMRDDRGEMIRNAPLLGLFRRLCKLLYLHVKPVIVFDGKTPDLKMQTLLRRRAIRDQGEVTLKKAAEKLLFAQLQRIGATGTQTVEVPGQSWFPPLPPVGGATCCRRVSAARSRDAVDVSLSDVEDEEMSLNAGLKPMRSGGAGGHRGWASAAPRSRGAVDVSLSDVDDEEMSLNAGLEPMYPEPRGGAGAWGGGGGGGNSLWLDDPSSDEDEEGGEYADRGETVTLEDIIEAARRKRNESHGGKGKVVLLGCGRAWCLPGVLPERAMPPFRRAGAAVAPSLTSTAFSLKS
ncbi:XPG N-terminal domain-containing protein [Pavlovales sp. CCMP2436]|nr:XPG N-terminal domain-containing protein [Pavlovales sp. CCMP2436]